MIRARARLAIALVAAGLAGAGLATASSGQAASPAPTRPAALEAVLRCRDIQRGIDFTGNVRISAALPVSVVPGEQFTIRPAVLLTADRPVSATPVSVSLFAPVAAGGGVGTITLPTHEATAVTVRAGLRGSVDLRFADPSAAVMRLGGVEVGCHPIDSVSGGLSVPIVPPADGSQRGFDVGATATCTDEGHTFTWEFRMIGVAPTVVVPGEVVGITFDWRGMASQLQETATVEVTGADGPGELRFHARMGSQGIHLSAGTAGRGGEVRFELARVDSALQAFDPPHVNNAMCTFPGERAVVVVPITDDPATSTSTTTTTTTTTRHAGVPSLLALLTRLICLVFRIC